MKSFIVIIFFVLLSGFPAPLRSGEKTMNQPGCKLSLVEMLAEIRATQGRNILIEEMGEKSIKIVVTGNDGTGEGYTINLATGEIRMDWHEHPDSELDEQAIEEL